MNLIYSILGDQFREWVSSRIKVRNEKVAENNDLMIELDPKIAEAFKNSLNISSKSDTHVFNNIETNPVLYV